MSFSVHGSFSSISGHDDKIQPWPATAALMVAEVVGTGVLALGGAFSQLGWTMGILVLVVGLVVNVYTSLLLNSVHMEFPDVITFGDALHKLMGRSWGIFGYLLLYVYLFLVCANYVVVLAESIKLVVPAFSCRAVGTAVGCVLLLPGNQFRTLGGLTILSVVSFGTILTTIVICLWTLTESSGQGSLSCNGKIQEANFLNMNAAICAFIFAYAGQSIMLEMQAEMRNAADFPKSVFGSFGTLFIVYIVVPAVAFSTCGSKTPGELMDVLVPGPRRVVVGVLMVVHLIVTYTILQQVLTRATCMYFVPRALEFNVGARVRWLAVSTSYMLLAYVVANSVPLFEDIVNVTGGALSTQAAFTIPGILFLALQWHRHKSRIAAPQAQAHLVHDGAEVRVPTRKSFADVCFQRGLTVVTCLVLVLAAYCTVVGTISSVALMVDHAREGVNRPFQCE